MKTNNFLKLLLFIGVCQVAGLIGSIFTINAIPNWYATLVKPSFSPPNYLFGPVWTILYTLMGVSVYLIYQKRSKNNKSIDAINIFGLQLFLNSLWSIIFFGAKLPSLAFVEIVILWGIIIWTIIKFYKINKTASYLLIPYLLWVTFASALNLAIVLLN